MLAPRPQPYAHARKPPQRLTRVVRVGTLSAARLHRHSEAQDRRRRRWGRRSLQRRNAPPEGRSVGRRCCGGAVQQPFLPAFVDACRRSATRYLPKGLASTVQTVSSSRRCTHAFCSPWPAERFRVQHGLASRLPNRRGLTPDACLTPARPGPRRHQRGGGVSPGHGQRHAEGCDMDPIGRKDYR